LVSGEHDPEHLGELTKGTLRAKRGGLIGVLGGCPRDHHAFMVGQMLAHVEDMEKRIAQYMLEGRNGRSLVICG
jgi:transposase